MRITRTLAICGLAAIAALAPACKTAGYKDITVQTEAEAKTNFDGYSSYMWVAAAAVVRDPEAEWTPPDVDISAEIMFLVNRELRERDLSEVATTPDLLVMFGLGIDMKNFAEVVNAEDGTTSFENVPEGAVVVVMTDPETHKVVWIGSAKSEIKGERTTKDKRERLDWAISEMFEQSPF